VHIPRTSGLETLRSATLPASSRGRVYKPLREIVGLATGIIGFTGRD